MGDDYGHRRPPLQATSRPPLGPGVPKRKTLEFENLTFTHDITSGDLIVRKPGNSAFDHAYSAAEVEELRAMLRAMGKPVDL